MNKTFIIDIDGTIFEYSSDISKIYNEPSKTLESVREKIYKWHASEHMIILMTARPESMRNHTIQQLHNNMIPYDILIMGVRHGPRIVINDKKPAIENMAIGITINRNEGFKNIDIQ